jgi:hypothetical protein
MKDRLEIQRAHDILIAIIIGDVPNPFPAESEIHAAILRVRDRR